MFSGCRSAGFRAAWASIYPKEFEVQSLLFSVLLDFFEQRGGFGELGVEILAEQAEHLFEHRVAQRIVNLVARFPADDDLTSTEDSEMLGSIGLFELQLVDQLPGGQLAFAERLDDGDAGGVPEALKNARFKQAEFVRHCTLVYSIIRMCGEVRI